MPSRSVSWRTSWPSWIQLLQRLAKRVELRFVQVRYGPERHAAAGPVPHVKAAHRARRQRRNPVCWPGEQIDRVVCPLVNEGGDRLTRDVVQPATPQRESERGEVGHRRREVQLAQEPRFH